MPRSRQVRLPVASVAQPPPNVNVIYADGIEAVRAARAGVAEEDQVAWSLERPRNADAGMDLVSGVVRKTEASAGGLIRGVQHEAGTVEAASCRPFEVAAAPDVGLAELRRGGPDEVAGEAGREVQRELSCRLRARELA